MKSGMAVSIVAITVAVTVAVSSGWSAAQESKGSSYTKIPTVKGIETLKVGSTAPDFAVRDLADKEFRLKDRGGKEAVLLFFWSFFCGPCREEIPLINDMTKQYYGKGLHVVGVNLDGKELKKAIDKFVVNEKIAFRIVFDELVGDSFMVADPYGVAGTPALFLIDKKGVVAFSAVGTVAPPQLKKEIEKVVQ
ncbi:MAG: redoxin domain-containing protein [Deltaproteobacteria bacterium]|nr:redoxin domain-containing protein [Deltaproteobacteria bacterium]